MNSLLLWIGGLLVAVLGLLFAVPYVVDWNAYRGVFEEEATRILGRDVRVGGTVNLRLLPSPYVRFEKVRISDSGAALGEPFFRAEAFTLWLSPAPLLRGAIEANEVELDRPVLRLAVDAGGNGNWQQIRITPGSLPFVPSEVVLQQVRIREGIVSLRTPSTPEPLTLSGIDGELAATSLDGPYRFRGNVTWGTVLRELRIATSQREPNGQLRYKASVRALDTGNTYSFDGSLSELSARGRHTGVLTARLPLASFAAESQGRPRASRSGDIVDLKANVEGDIDSMRLSDVQLAFEQAGRPQLLSGDLSANWRNGLRMETRLASRWLDLDQLAGTEAAGPAARPAPADIVRRLMAQIGSLLPADGTSLLAVDVDQLNLGGEALGGVRLALARTGGLTSIGELRASLPGNARGELRGRFVPAAQMAGPAAPTALDGEIVLHGSSYRRFLAWAGLLAPLDPAETAQAQSDSAFSVASRMRLLPERLTLTDASVELGSRQVAGSLDWRWSGERQLDVSLEGPALDVSPLLPGILSLGTTEVAPASGGSAGSSGSPLLAALASRAGAVERAVGSLRLRARAQSLSDGTNLLSDVDADVTLRGDRLQIAGLRFTGTSGAALDARGEIGGLGGELRGAVRGWIGARSRDGIAGVARILPDEARRMSGDWFGRVETADLGFVLTLGSGQTTNALIRADGMLDDVRVGLDLKLEGGLGRWREAPIDLSAKLEGPSAPALLRAVGGYSGVARAGGAANPEAGGVVQIKAAGPNASQLIGLLEIETGGGSIAARARYEGRVGIDASSGAVGLTGTLAVDGRAADLLVMAGGPRRTTGFEAPVRGTLAFERTGGTTKLAGRDLTIGASPLGGELLVSRKDERTRIDAKLTTGRLALLDAASLLLDGDRSVSIAPDAGDAASPWPDAPMSLSLLERVEGRVVVSAPVAVLTDGLEIADAVLEVGLSPGRLTLSGLSGSVLGGRLTVRGAAEQAAGGVNLDLETRITGARLATLAGVTGPQRNLGEANLAVSLSGRATSLRAAATQLAGRGEIELRNARVEGIGADLVEKAAAGAIDGGEGDGVSVLAAQIERARAASSVALGNRKLPVEVADGIAKVGAIEVSAPEAILRNVTTVDIAALKADSEWRVTPRRPLAGKPAGARSDPLPAIALVWAGPLAGIAGGKPRLSAETLEREITIRRMERETERLEELRRRDEQRAIEIERERRSEDGQRAPASGTAAQKTETAPIIQAPLPITQGAAAQEPSQSVTRPPPQRPSPPPRRQNSKTPLDALMGNQ